MRIGVFSASFTAETLMRRKSHCTFFFFTKPEQKDLRTRLGNPTLCLPQCFLVRLKQRCYGRWRCQWRLRPQRIIGCSINLNKCQLCSRDNYIVQHTYITVMALAQVCSIILAYSQILSALLFSKILCSSYHGRFQIRFWTTRHSMIVRMLKMHCTSAKPGVGFRVAWCGPCGPPKICLSFPRDDRTCGYAATSDRTKNT